MSSFSIGRAPSCDIVVVDPTVSRQHARLSAVGPGRFLFVDTGSTAGSCRREGDDWLPMTEAQLAAGDLIRLGEFETTVGDLLERARLPSPPRPFRRVERDPLTGRIVVRNR